jgi:alpha-D-xyloside xylohydrolase
VVQSTADFTGEALDLWVVPGADGKYELYEDAGLDDGYERGASSVIAITWNDRDGVLRLAARAGRFPGMLSTRRFVVHRVQAGGMPLQGAEGVSIVYDGRALAVRLPPSSPPSPNVS